MFKWSKKKNQFDENIELDNDDIFIEEEIKTYIPEGENKKERQVSFEATSAKFSPIDFESMKSAADALLKNKRIIISFKNMTSEDRKRSLNFLSGIIYVINGDIQRIEPQIYEFKYN